jgi:hypothetical protein
MNNEMYLITLSVEGEQEHLRLSMSVERDWRPVCRRLLEPSGVRFLYVQKFTLPNVYNVLSAGASDTGWFEPVWAWNHGESLSDLELNRQAEPSG